MKTHVSSLPQTVEAAGTLSLNKLYKRFIAWTNAMDFYRLIILVGTILFQGCVTAPFTMWSMQAIPGYNDVQMTIITLGSFAVLVTNLSVQPMRVTIPVFIVSTMVQLGVIATNLLSLL